VLEVALERVPQALPDEEPAKVVQKPVEGAPAATPDVLPH
jgi:hypothetical protein